MKERIIKIMEKEAMSYSKFAETIGIQRSAMSHIISGRNNPSLDVLLKILERFTYIDSDWLLFGKGNMLRLTDSPRELDLFGNTPEITPKVQVIDENRQDSGVKESQKAINQTGIETIIPVTTVSKKVTKIMIFYSDNTFDTFIPEKNIKS